MTRTSLIAASIILVSCGAPGNPETNGMLVQALPDTAGQGFAPLIASARLESGEEALLFGSGRILQVLVEEGDSVASGQILVTLSGDAVVSSAVAASIEGADAARLQAENAQKLLEQSVDLYEAGAISQLDLEGARTAAAAAEAQYRAARAGIAASSSVREATVVQAPFRGVIGRVWARAGAMAGSDPLLMMSGGGHYMIRALLPERELGSILPGAPAWFESPALPGIRFDGSVTSVASGIDPVTCLLPVTISIEDPRDELASGLYGTVAIARRDRFAQEK